MSKISRVQIIKIMSNFYSMENDFSSIADKIARLHICLTHVRLVIIFIILTFRTYLTLTDQF
jgi:hypothetical protein